MLTKSLNKRKNSLTMKVIHVNSAKIEGERLWKEVLSKKLRDKYKRDAQKLFMKYGKTKSNR